MESVKLATGLGGHGPQMLYPRQQPAGHPGPQVIPQTTRSYDGQYKGAISPPLGPSISTSRAYPSYPILDGRHGGPRYLQQPTYIPTYHRDPTYSTPITDRPAILHPPHQRRPSIMGNYGGYGKDMVHVLNPSNLSMVSPAEPYKRIKLSQPLRTDTRYSPLVIDTNENHTSRETSYYPQVEAISPTLPPDPRDESPLQSGSRDDLIKQLEQVDKEITQTDAAVTNLHKKEKELEAAAQKGESQSQDEEEDAKETKHQSTAQIIYAENRKLAVESHASLNKLIPNSEVKRVLPLYHQPLDCPVYQQNKTKFISFKQTLLEHLKRRREDKNNKHQQLINSYSNLTSEWLRKVDKIENSKKNREKVSKSRELFEKVFPELRKQREDKERFSRVGARVKSDAEMEEIMDGLQEQENEDKKMRAYAVIPPIMLDENERRYRFINNNGSIDNPFEEYKQYKYVNIWTDQECDIFKEKYLQHPKNFVIISSYLEKKSVSDAVRHYYVSKKKENYKMLVKRRMRRPRTKNQTQMEAMHLNTRVRTRGAAAKDIKSEPADDMKDDAEGINGAEEGMWHSDQQIDSMETDEEPANLNATVNSMEVTEKDKENLNTTENIIPKNEIKQEINHEIKQEVKQEDMDSSEEEASGESVPHDCFVCKNHVEHFGLSRRLKPSQASNYGLNQSQIPTEARVCTNCNCRLVRRSRICLVPTCTAHKRKVKRLKTLPSRWNTLSSSIKEPIIKELQLPNDLTKCCLYCYNRIMNKIGPEVTEPVDISKWSDSDIEKFKTTISEVGCNWTKISDKLNGKSDRDCKAFYNSFKENYKLDVILSQYKQSKGKSSPPTVTDEEESGSSSSSCEESEMTQHPPAYPPPQVRHDSASDTLSASSPPPANCVEDSKEQAVSSKEAAGNPREDYDSSATTLSADEVVERDSPPEIEHIPHPGEKKRNKAQFSQNQEAAVFTDIISQTITATLSGREKVNAPQNSDITMESILQNPNSYYNESLLDLTVKKRERSPDRMQSHPSLNHRADMQTLAVRGGAQVTVTGKDCHPPMAHSNSISYLPTSTYNAQDFPKSPIYIEQQRSTPQTTTITTGVTSPLMVYSSHRGQPVKPYKQMAPPISVTVSSPSYNMIQGTVNQSPRRIAKVDKTGNIPGSIIRGTPVNQPPHHPSSMHSARYDLVTKSAVSSGGGSITQGTPILHDKKSTSTLHLKDNIIESRGGVEIISRQPQDVPPRDYRQRVTMSGASVSPAAYSFTSYANYSNRPSFSDSKKIIEADYITSIHMMPSTRPDKNLILSRQRDPSPSPHTQRNYPTSDRRPDTIIDRRPNKEVDLRPIERPVDKKKVQIMKSSGIVPVNNYYPNNPHRTASPFRDATPNPPSSENHEYRSMNTYLAHPRHNSVIQNCNKMTPSSIERYSPHSVISTGAEYHHRNPKPIDSTASIMVGHQRPITMYEHRPSSRDKALEGKPSYSEHIRLAEETDKIAITYMDKGVPKPRNNPDNLSAQSLLDKIINDNIKTRRPIEEIPRYRREGECHNYLVSEAEKRGRSPYSKKDEVVTLKDTSHRSHKEGHPTSLQLSHHVNLIKASQPHIDSVINRDYSTNDPKKMNHHSYTRPPIEITRFDVRQGSQAHSDHKLHPIKYSVESEKEMYDTRSPHRPTSSRMIEEERRIIRIPQPQVSQNAFNYIANKLQHIFREESPEKDRRVLSHSRSQGPHQSSPSSQQSPQIPHSQSSQMGQIRANSHFDDDINKKRPRLDLPADMSRPPSRPRSSEAKEKLQQAHKDDIDSPQSGEMVIDENPKDDRAHSSDDKRKYPYGYSGFSQSWSAASSKNGRFQGGYEPNVEPVSDDE